MSEVLNQEERLAAAQMATAQAEATVVNAAASEAARLDQSETRQANTAPEPATEAPAGTPEAAATAEAAKTPEQVATETAEAEKQKQANEAKERAAKGNELKELVIKAFQVPEGFDEAKSHEFITTNLAIVEKQINADQKTFTEQGITLEWLANTKKQIEFWNNSDAQTHRYETWPAAETAEDQAKQVAFKTGVEHKCVEIIVKSGQTKGALEWVRNLGERLKSDDEGVKARAEALQHTEGKNTEAMLAFDLGRRTLERMNRGQPEYTTDQFIEQLPDSSEFTADPTTAADEWFEQNADGHTVFTKEGAACAAVAAYGLSGDSPSTYIRALSEYFNITPDQSTAFGAFAVTVYSTLEGRVDSSSNATSEEEDEDDGGTKLEDLAELLRDQQADYPQQQEQGVSGGGSSESLLGVAAAAHQEAKAAQDLTRGAASRNRKAA